MVPAGFVGPAVARGHGDTYAPRPMPSLVRHGALAAALALLVLAGLTPGLAPAGARGIGPLPACRYDDIMTEPRGYEDWSTTLVDTILRVPKRYIPPDLVPVAQAGIAGRGKIRAIVVDDLRAMSEAAASAGNGIGVQSAYRSYEAQQAVFDGWVAQFGYARALKVSARPGHSEHQLGLAIDFRSDPGGSPFTGSWGSTPAGSWMGKHSWEYGFIRSYPAHKQDVTCYASEAWHFRYVGRDLAATIHASGRTLREYLWANFTTATVPAVTPRPGQSAAPTAPPASPAASGGLAESPPASSAGGSPLPSAAESPSPDASAGLAGQSPPPVDGAPTADLDPGIAVALGAILIGILAATLLVMRRGRSGVGL
jgi:D-alanyl-D-alanine carboxypeptidase